MPLIVTPGAIRAFFGSGLGGVCVVVVGVVVVVSVDVVSVVVVGGGGDESASAYAEAAPAAPQASSSTRIAVRFTGRSVSGSPADVPCLGNSPDGRFLQQTGTLQPVSH